MDGRAKQLEVLERLIDLGVYRGVKTLNTLLDSRVRLEPLTVKLLGIQGEHDAPLAREEDQFAVVRMGFNGSLTGDSGLVFDKESALKLVNRIAGDDLGSGDFDFVSTGVITEIGNIVLNNVLGSISNTFKLSLDFVVPSFFEGDSDSIFRLGVDCTGRTGLLAETHLAVEEFRAEGNIVLFFEQESYEMLMSVIKERPL